MELTDFVENHVVYMLDTYFLALGIHPVGGFQTHFAFIRAYIVLICVLKQRGTCSCVSLLCSEQLVWYDLHSFDAHFFSVIIYKVSNNVASVRKMYENVLKSVQFLKVM